MVQRVTDPPACRTLVITTMNGSPCISRNKAECASLMHGAYWSAVTLMLHVKRIPTAAVNDKHVTERHADRRTQFNTQF